MSDQAIESSELGGSVPMEVSTSGPVTSGQRKAIETMVTKLIDSIDDPVLRSRIRLEQHPEHSKAQPVMARIVLDIRGGAVRAHVTAGSVHEAIDAVEARLRGQLRHRNDRRISQQQRGPSSGDGAWRHGDMASERPPYFPRPVDERRIVRQKSFSPGMSSVEEAVFDLEQMSYDFYLFVESDGGDDAIVARAEDGDGYTVHSLTGAVNGAVEHPFPLEVDDHPAPELDIETAEERLDAGHEPWVFFRDAETKRGHVLYRRYDGHYGLIVPLDEPD